MLFGVVLHDVAVVVYLSSILITSVITMATLEPPSETYSGEKKTLHEL